LIIEKQQFRFLDCLVQGTGVLVLGWNESVVVDQEFEVVERMALVNFRDMVVLGLRAGDVDQFGKLILFDLKHSMLRVWPLAVEDALNCFIFV
jgi:hypothetical protein